MNIAERSTIDAAASGEDRARTIRDRLRDAIVDRRLAPGTRLPEHEVGALFDVSRTMARSALLMLSFEGLVTIERNRGAVVANPSPDEARQVFAARRMIEPGIAAAVCGRATAADLAAFRSHLDDEAHHMAERGPSFRRAEIKASGDFHLMLASIAGNAILQRFMEELVARSSLVIALYGRTGASSCGHADHQRLVEAIERGDAALAGDTMLRHIDHIEADLDLRIRRKPALKEALDI